MSGAVSIAGAILGGELPASLVASLPAPLFQSRGRFLGVSYGANIFHATIGTVSIAGAILGGELRQLWRRNIHAQNSFNRGGDSWG